MAKVKSKWICQECGYETAGYLGKCPECGAWGSLVEEVQFASKGQNSVQDEFINREKPELLKNIHIGEEVRVSTNISEFDRILGGGLVQGLFLLQVIRELESQLYFCKPAENYAKAIKRFYTYRQKKVQAS